MDVVSLALDIDVPVFDAFESWLQRCMLRLPYSLHEGEWSPMRNAIAQGEIYAKLSPTPPLERITAIGESL